MCVCGGGGGRGGGLHGGGGASPGAAETVLTRTSARALAGTCALILFAEVSSIVKRLKMSIFCINTRPLCKLIQSGAVIVSTSGQ